MDDWDAPVSDPVSDRSFREALFEALDGRPRSVRPKSEGLLWIASALLLGTNLLLVLAVFVNVIGGLGPVNPSRILWAALGLDLVGVALLGWIIWDSAGPVEGPARLIRRIAALPLADDVNAWLVAKVIVAPNVFLSGYASSLDLGRRIRAARTRRP